ncbi:DUF1127 domain-containing protein [Aestuariivirga sp.]|uniref:DUF1127 domain-containing protein n=1 Tax=Aestuariivirga sp. TaxID=2650926 RepID=UPI00391AA86D
MTTQSYEIIPQRARHGLASRAWRVLSHAAEAWRENRRRKAQLAELMSMDPHVLSDIGVKLTPVSSAASSLVEFTPAVVATRIYRGSGPR